jgi:outer membrane protein assembly factor BamB
MCRAKVLIWFVLSIAATSYSSASDRWPQWRGEQFNGVSEETNLPTEWSQTENVLWRFPLPGASGATPAIWKDHIFVSTADGDDLYLICVDTQGNELWRKLVAGGSNQKVRGDEGNYASPSPSTNGERVFIMMGTGDLACFNFAGDELWHFNLQDKYGKFDIQFGMTSTPVLDKDRLYLQLLFTGGKHVIALDLDGKEVWHHNRESDARNEGEHSYASPTIYRDSEREFLLTHGGDCIVAHSLKDGSEIFRSYGMNPKENYNRTFRLISSPATAPGIIVAPTAKNGPVLAIDPAAKGDITSDSQMRLWTLPKRTPDVPSPLIYDGLVYLCRAENGIVECLDAKSGERVYEQSTHRDRHRASPVYADGKIYLAARDGVMTVLKAGREPEILATNKMEEAISSSPAIAAGRIYVRTFNALYAIGKE